MKRITKIEIENSRAYYDRIAISLEKGENLLLYGENGSGKTSLCKSLNDFLLSFYTQVKFISNRYKSSDSIGEVKLSIGDYNPTSKLFTNVVDYLYGKNLDNTLLPNTGFLKALSLTKGFLNYRDLLKVYLYEDDNPNLFDFFVLKLLKNHIPLKQGMRVSIIKEWNQIQDDVFNVYHRNENKHRRGISRLASFEIILRAVLDDLFSEVNRYLYEYFGDFSLHINYDLKPLAFSYGQSKSEWQIYQNLTIIVSSGNALVNHYTAGLNEARLSAIAICLYLAALRSNPGSDLRIMFLDDIFIGIDSANRLPILNILIKEFDDFQIILATYDRSWYSMAKNYLTLKSPEDWKYMSLYARPMINQGIAFMEPVMVCDDPLLSHAQKYLHGNRNIDLPASANYFRKAAEELLSEKFLPKELFLNEDYSITPDFKLEKHLDSVDRLFSQIGYDRSHLQVIHTYLHPLLHPLSHYEEEAPVYRSELLFVEKAIIGLMRQVNYFPNKCRLLLGKNNKVCIHYNYSDGSYLSSYYLILEDNLWLFKDNFGNASLTRCKCRVVHIDGKENGKTLPPCNPSIDDPKFKYSSIKEALQIIYDHEVNEEHHNVIPNNDYDIVFICKEKKALFNLRLARNALFYRM